MTLWHDEKQRRFVQKQRLTKSPQHHPEKYRRKIKKLNCKCVFLFILNPQEDFTVNVGFSECP